MPAAERDEEGCAGTPGSSAAQGMRLRERTAAVDYAAKVLDTVTRISTAPDHAHVVSLLKLATARLGADVSVFTSLVRDHSSLPHFRYLLACDQRWGLEYAKNAWCFDDPWLRYALHNTEPIRSGELSPSSERERRVSESAAHWGFRSAVIVPVASPAAQSRVGMLCLGSNAEGHFDDCGYPSFRCLARTLAGEVAEWMYRRIKAELIARARITDADLALLRFQQRGQGSKMIAAAMKIDVGTIDCRFQRLSLRLGTANRRAAVRLAEIYGLI